MFKDISSKNEIWIACNEWKKSAYSQSIFNTLKKRFLSLILCQVFVPGINFNDISLIQFLSFFPRINNIFCILPLQEIS